MLDEIDKVSWVAADALLDALDPTQNARFHDLYVGVPFDLSEVFFVATANVLEEIPTTLQNRLEVIEIAGYSEAEKLEIAKRVIVPARVRDHGLTGDLIEFEDKALRAMIRDHANEMGVRDLDRSVSAICRRTVLRLETSSDRTPAKVTVNESMVGEVLGTRTGDEEGLPGVEQLRAMIDRGGMPPAARRQAKNELKLMLSRSPRDSEYHDRFTYLQWLARLPWNARDEERIDLQRTRELLDEQHWGLAKAKKRILEYLAVRKLGGGKGAILCLVGPPGVGKTSMARSIADAIGRQFAAFSCAGVSDATELRGHNRTWRGAQPGRLPARVRQNRSEEPGADAGRNRQDLAGLEQWGRPRVGSARGTRPDTERQIHRQLRRSAVRPVGSALRRHGERAGQDRGSTPGPAGGDRTAGLLGGREVRDRPGASGPPPARGERADGRAGQFHRRRAARAGPGLHARGRGA